MHARKRCQCHADVRTHARAHALARSSSTHAPHPRSHVRVRPPQRPSVLPICHTRRYHSSGAAGTAAFLSALAASPVISLHALNLPRLTPDQGVCAAIERLSRGRGARLRSAHLLAVPDAACAAHLHALSELTLGPLPTYPAPETVFLGFKFPHLRRLSISPADNATWSIFGLLALLRTASVPSLRRLQLGWYVQGAPSSASTQAQQLDAPLRALTASGDAPPIALAGRWELHAAGMPPIVVGPLSELVPVWQGACAGPFKGCKCVLLKGAVPAE